MRDRTALEPVHAGKIRQVAPPIIVRDRGRMSSAGFARSAVTLALGAALGCTGAGAPHARVEPGTDGADRAGPTGWRVVHREEFAALRVPAAPWSPDPVPDDGPFADGGAFFRRRGVAPPPAFRVSQALGDGGWLTVESYSRSSATPLTDLVQVVADPAGGRNQVLRLRSPAHTDATVIRSTEPLAGDYRISLRIGWASFGDGESSGRNGYHGGENALPWWKSGVDIAGIGNGFYWLAILDDVPRPHNNVWIHHHRKVVIDSDNHFPPWMEIHDGSGFVKSGRRPIMMFALDGRSTPDVWHGHDFLSWSAGSWQPSGAIRAVDSYRPRTWYRASIERRGDRFTLEIAGEFAHGGRQVYRGTIDAASRCVWHYNRSPALDPACVDMKSFPETGEPREPRWPAGRGWPDYVMLGDPHNNFYEGTVYYDDIQLEVPR